MEDLFDFQMLRIQQPGKWLPNRASYEIFNARRELVAIATETEGHGRRKLPDTRIIEVTTAARQPILSLTKQTSEWITDLHDPGGELIGRIRTGGTKRLYTLLDEQDQTVGKVEGDLALKHFSVKGPKGSGEFARIRKTFAGITKEMLTTSDHYMIEFSAPVSPPARTLTAMMPIVLDLTLYGPF